MAFSDWLIVGGTVWLLRKVAKNTAEERKHEEEERQRIEQEIREKKNEYKRLVRESKRLARIDEIRRAMPCSFEDGISYTEFESIVKRSVRKIKRIKNITIENARVTCVVESQSGCSEWVFYVDFNNWGHITGTSWLQVENHDSSIPEHCRSIIATEIKQLIHERDIRLFDYSDAVDANTSLGKSEERTRRKKKLFARKRMIVSQHSGRVLVGEHLYPVISVLKSNGFEKIILNPIKDVGKSSGKFVFQVKSITIDEKPLERGESYDKEDELVIDYHEKLEIIMPWSAKSLEGIDYEEAVFKLESLGFSNIKVKPIRDLRLGLLKKDGAVESLNIHKNEGIRRKEAYKYDEEIVIKYHTFIKK